MFSRAGSAQLAEHPRKVPLRFEAASYGDIQHPNLGRSQHLLRTLNPVAQDKLVRTLTRRFAKHL
jgi:hypothetical protein